MDGNKLGLQAWTSRKKDVAPGAELFEPISQLRDGFRRKPKGGFWTSTFDERYGSDWIRWCLSESFECDPGDPVFRVWTLEPDPTARVYEIDSYDDLAWLCEHYGTTRDYGSYSETFPSWLRVAQAYDAVHLTEEGQWATRLSDPNLYSWDCESTLWLRWRFAAVRDLGMVACDQHAQTH